MSRLLATRANGGKSLVWGWREGGKERARAGRLCGAFRCAASLCIHPVTAVSALNEGNVPVGRPTQVPHALPQRCVAYKGARRGPRLRKGEQLHNHGRVHLQNATGCCHVLSMRGVRSAFAKRGSGVTNGGGLVPLGATVLPPHLELHSMTILKGIPRIINPQLLSALGKFGAARPFPNQPKVCRRLR